MRILPTRLLYLFALLPLLLAPLPASAQASEPAAEEPVVSAADQARALVEVLNDEGARNALIGELERIAQNQPADGEPAVEPETEAEAAAEAEQPASLGRRIAETTQESAEAIAESATRLWAQISKAPSNFAALGDAADMGVLFDTLRALALVIATTYAVLLTLRFLAVSLFRRIGRMASQHGPAGTILLIIASVVIDAVVVAVAWAAGYAIALGVGDMGSMRIQQTLYLNAFLMVEMSRVAVRAILAPSTEALRLIHISDAAARRLPRWAAAIILLVGYGELLAVPVVNQNVSFLAGRALSSLVAAIAILLAITLVMRSRRAVAGWLTDTKDGTPRMRILDWLARHWHWPVLTYLMALLVIVIARPGGVLFPVLAGSARIAAAIVIGMVVTGVLTRAMRRGVSLPEPVTTRLPLLERRLNTFVPAALFALRMLVFLIVAAIAADVVGLFNLTGWAESRLGVEVTATAISVALIALAAFLVWLALSSWVDYRLNPEFGKAVTSREITLLTLARNAATIAILVVTLMFILSEIGIDIAPLLASAGVLGLAIGFGAQKMVQDIITGVFIQFENAINVGDVITVGGTTGTVERLTIRSVGLRDLYGTYHMVPFSSVDMVSNFNRGFAYHVMDMGIAYQEDVGEAREALEEAFTRLKSDADHSDNIVGDLEWFGLQSLGDSAVVVRARIKTMPGQQWAVGRAYNEYAKQVFDERGIEIPFPHQTIYWGEAKDGRTPPLRIESESAKEQT